MCPLQGGVGREGEGRRENTVKYVMIPMDLYQLLQSHMGCNYKWTIDSAQCMALLFSLSKQLHIPIEGDFLFPQSGQIYQISPICQHNSVTLSSAQR